MRLRFFRRAAIPAAMVLLVLPGAWMLPGAAAQQPYRNIVNMRFRTVSNGPQSALIVNVKDPNDRAAVRQAVLQRSSALFRSRAPAIGREIAFLRQHNLVKPGQKLVMSEAAIVSQNGRLVLPSRETLTRSTRAVNDITFSIPTTGDGAWSAQDAANLTNLVNLLYPELRDHVLGHPGWSGVVTILNKDPTLGTVAEPIGALLVINGSNVEILFPSFSDYETQFLAMAQVMAQAFHGPMRIAYDAWEQGMGRAAAIVAARDLQSVITAGGQNVNPNNGFYYTPDYDLLNQPPLGNNTFTPPTKSSQPFNPTTLSGMLVPRLQMSSTAWLKCFIENPNFFQAFNTAYYAAYATDSTIANDVTRLRELAAAAQPTVEMLPFDDWYERQYVLDTSITYGPKLYAYVQPTFPSSTQGNDGGAAVYLVYYQTTATGDETDSNGTANVIYWDYTFQNRLFLPTFNTVTISSGFGTVAPYFTNIGGNPADQMRVAMDFAVNKDYVRVYFPAGETGTETTPNDFSGVVVGADAGALSVTYEGGGTVTTNVQQGVFGAVGGGSVPNGFSRTHLTFTPTGGQPVTYQRNTAFNNTIGVAPIFLLVSPNSASTLTHTFPAGVQMISLPVQPFLNDLTSVLGISPNSALLAQYRQDASTSDKYLRYPSLPLYQPGYSLWANFPTALAANNIQGQSTDIQKNISIALEFGWNQIGSPYNTSLDVTADLSVQYLGGDVVSLAQAVSNGWIAAGVTGFSPAAGYQDITTSNNPAFPLNTMEAWKGYWIRVLVTEGVTLTYSNPNNRAAALRGSSASSRASRTRSVAPPPGSGNWRMPLSISDTMGNTSSALFGQSPQGADTFQAALDVASPPLFPGASTLGVSFPHSDWDTGMGNSGGNFLTDIRRSASNVQWNVIVSTPNPGQTYTLTWSRAATLPNGMRLTLVDTVSGAKQLMNTTSGYSFRPGKGETTRSFQIVAQPHALGRPLITNVTAFAPPGRGRSVPTMTISYELSVPAETSIEILLGGRTVRHLATGRAASAGVNQMVWDTRDDQGRSLSTGVYTVQVTAHTPDGEQTRSAVPLLLTR